MRRGRRVYEAHPLLGRYLLVELMLDWPAQFHRVARTEGVAGSLVAA